MTELPSGTVTFLFTDIERSTESAAALGDERWAEALQTHRDVLRPVFEKHAGVEVGTEGDAFFVAFARAHDAVVAAAEGQRALQAHPWPGETQLRVRMGLHTGEALVRGAGYVGHEVHRAKRISDAAHGGQILLSETTADLVGKGSLIDLGSHRLKDLGEPQRIFQIGTTKFPPLRSLDSFTHSLPPQRSAFIGRETEIAEIRRLLGSNRIVTLTGVGGCGKTRLALQVGAEELEQFADGVFLVNLAPISDPDAVITETATAVGVPIGGGLITGGAGGPVEDLLLNYLATREVLIVLDNCEHLIDACAEVADRVLEGCPKAKILATSREGLRVEGEQTWTVPSLSLPKGEVGIEASEAVSLFKVRASSVRPDFELSPDNIEAVTEICRRLDGIPLAIEFAAARVSHLSVRQIARRLDDRFQLLTGGQRRVQRQHTLQAALDWSFDLLDESERALLRRLSVFAGHFSVEAAETVCGDEELRAAIVTDVLGSLVLKSLVDIEHKEDEARYRLLETVRAYAAERLTHADEAKVFRDRHRDWYLSWLESHPFQVTLLDYVFAMRCRGDAPNLIAALELSAAQNRLDLVARMVSRMFSGWGGAFPPGPDRFRWARLGAEAEGHVDPDVRALCLSAAAWWGQFYDTRSAYSFGQQAIEAAKGASVFVHAYTLALGNLATGLFATATRDLDLAQRSYAGVKEAIALSVGNDLLLSVSYISRGYLEMYAQRFDAAYESMEKSHAHALAALNEAWVGGGAIQLAAAAHVTGRHERAWDVFTRVESMDPDRISLRPGLASVVGPLIAKGKGTDQARSALRDVVDAALRSPFPGDVEDLLLGAAAVLAIDGDHVGAGTLLSYYRVHIFEAGQLPRSPAAYMLYLHYRDIVRAALTPDAAKEVRDRGSAITRDEALALAFAAKDTV